MKEKNSKTGMIRILIITIIFGVSAFFVAKLVDSNVAKVTELRNDIDEMKRIASNKEDKIEQLQDVDQYSEFYEEMLPKTEEIIGMLQQIEAIGQMTSTSVTIKLEEGVITIDSIEFKDTKDKAEFLKSLEVKEYSPQEAEASETPAAPAQGPGANVAMQFGSSETGTGESDVKFQYLEINLNVKGTYEDIRRYISLIQQSEYIMNIEEIRMVKTKDGRLDTGITLRAFIFE